VRKDPMENFRTNPHCQRYLLISAIDISLLRFRGRLIEALVAAGHEVVVAAPSFAPDTEQALRALGAVTATFTVARTSFNLLRDYRTYRDLKALMVQHRIDVVLPYTIKPVIYGSLAGRSLKLPVVSLITGLGYTFSSPGLKGQVIRSLIVRLYRWALAGNRAVIFQNRDDEALFRDLRILPAKQRTEVVGGSGVDLTEFTRHEPRQDANLRFVFVARLLVEKGIGLFLDAAESLKQQYPQAEFHVMGNPQPGSPSAIDMARVERLAAQEVIVYHGRRPDIAEVLQTMDVIVSPSWYREGVPRSLLEALATGLAVIATDTPGTRETVRHGINGWQIPPQDGNALRAAMAEALAEPQRINAMSAASHALAVERFDVQIVNQAIMNILNDTVPNRAGGSVTVSS